MGVKYTIRSMQLEDVEVVGDIEAAVHLRPWPAKIFKECIRVGYRCFVICNDEKVIVGYIVMSAAIKTSHIFNIALAANEQGKGLGKLFLANMLNRARKARIERISLEVRPSNKAAIALYQGFGFAQVGVREGYYPDDPPEDALVFGLDLQQNAAD